MEQEANIQRQRIAQQDQLARRYRNTSSELDTMVISGADIMNIAVIFGLEVPESAMDYMHLSNYRVHMDAAPFRRITKQKLAEFARDQIDLMSNTLPQIIRRFHEV